MYYIYGVSVPSLLIAIESTDSMILCHTFALLAILSYRVSTRGAVAIG